MSHTKKVYEKVVEFRLREVINIIEDQLGFMLGRRAIGNWMICLLMKRCCEMHREKYAAFIDLENL